VCRGARGKEGRIKPGIRRSFLTGKKCGRNGGQMGESHAKWRGDPSGLKADAAGRPRSRVNRTLSARVTWEGAKKIMLQSRAKGGPGNSRRLSNSAVGKGREN